MNNMFKNIPDSMAGLLYIACGAVILLDAMGAINAGLLVIFGGVFLVWHGFVLLNGPQKLFHWVERFQSKKK